MRSRILSDNERRLLQALLKGEKLQGVYVLLNRIKRFEERLRADMELVKQVQDLRDEASSLSKSR